MVGIPRGIGQSHRASANRTGAARARSYTSGMTHREPVCLVGRGVSRIGTRLIVLACLLVAGTVPAGADEWRMRVGDDPAWAEPIDRIDRGRV